MDQVTRKRIHKDLPGAFDKLTAGLDSTTLMPSTAWRNVGTVLINGVRYEVQVVLTMPTVIEEDEEA